jgi:hypothetical protein
MIVLLLLLGFIAVAAGMFGLGLGIPVRETTFGAAVMVAASVAITGGFILVGLAAAVSELRRVLQHLRLPERGHGADRWMEPRLGGRPAEYPDAGHVIPTRFDAPETGDGAHGRTGREEPPPPTADILRPSASPDVVPAVPPAYDPTAFAPRRTPAASAAPERLDTIRPSDYRRPEKEEPGPQVEATEREVKSPPLAPSAEAPSAAIRPRILKTGTINDVAYTLFSDGSIETPTPEGTLRFASIDGFRTHLEKIAG